MVDEGGEHPRQSCDTLPNLLSLILKIFSFVVDFWLIKELFFKKMERSVVWEERVKFEFY